MILQSLIAGFNEVIYNITSALKMNFADYCNLDCEIEDSIIMARDGSLLTVFSVEGVNSVVPADTFRHVVDNLNKLLRPTFEKKGVIIQSVFTSDPSKKTIEAALSKITAPSRQTIKKLQYREAAESLLKGQEDCLLDIVAIEKNFLCIWTTSACLSPQENKELSEEIKNKLKTLPNLGNGANPFLSNKLMIDNHISNVNGVVNAISNCGILIKKMSVQEAIHEMRMGILVSPERDINIVGSNLNYHNQSMLSNSVNFSLKERQVNRERMQYDGSIPRLNEFAQIEVEPAGNNNQVLVDGVYFQPTLMERPPLNIMFFNNLFADLHQARAHGERIPYRILFTLASDGESLLNLKYTLATVLRKTNLNSKAIYEGASQIKGFIEEQGIVVKFSVHMITWGKTSDEATQRSSIFNTRVEGWGAPRLNIRTGNPIEGLAASSMGFSKSGIAQKAAAPLDRALALLPLARPTSLWKESPIIFRSLDGKPIPYVSMDGKFTYWVTFIAAMSGSGKSVLANWLNTAFYLNGGLDALPYVSIIDFGFSSAGFIKILKRFLPAHQEHYAVQQRVKNSEEFCVNPHQLGLGLRFPNDEEITFMTNLYCLAIEDPKTGESVPGDRDLISSMLRACFERYSDCYSNFPYATPKPYEKGVYKDIDDVLEEHKYQILDGKMIQKLQQRDISESSEAPKNYRVTSWWEIVDFLMNEKPIDTSRGTDYIKLAYLAHREAAFTMLDMLKIINQTPSLAEKYKTKVDKNNESIITLITDRISQFSQNYPIFAGRTQFDVEDARAISFDLEGVINISPKSNADYQSNAIFFMYAMRTLTQKFFLIPTDLQNNAFPFPPNIKPSPRTNIATLYKFHEKNVQTLASSKKRLMIDEFHYTSKSEQFMIAIQGFMRVVRKRNMELLLISQELRDFVFLNAKTSGLSEVDLLAYASTVFILSPQTGDAADFVKRKLNIKDAGTMHALANEIRSPKDNPMTGGSLFMWLKLDPYQFTHIVTNKLSNICLWNFDTTRVNMDLRDAMIATTLDENEAMDILARSFPPYKTEAYVQTMRNELMANNDTKSNPYQKLAEFLYRQDLQRRNFSR